MTCIFTRAKKKKKILMASLYEGIVATSTQNLIRVVYLYACGLSREPTSRVCKNSGLCRHSITVVRKGIRSNIALSIVEDHWRRVDKEVRQGRKSLPIMCCTIGPIHMFLCFVEYDEHYRGDHNDGHLVLVLL